MITPLQALTFVSAWILFSLLLTALWGWVLSTLGWRDE
jgi:hypothetical protein